MLQRKPFKSDNVVNFKIYDVINLRRTHIT